eukprot:ANDGO_03953.mRNA.1 hypothetical protein
MDKKDMSEADLRFAILRHGESEANVAGVIVSDPVNGDPCYGLTETGKLQAQTVDLSRLLTAVNEDGVINGQKIVILSSTFKRAVETAAIVAKRLGKQEQDVVQDVRLRERYFGPVLELASNQGYDLVWQIDASADPRNTSHFSQETPYEVRDRLCSLLQDAQNRYSGCMVVLVAHGDTLQIAQTIWECVDPCMHRSLPHLANCEMRIMGTVPPAGTVIKR